MRQSILSPKHKQEGAVLIVMLIMLLLLNIIGITGISETNLQEKMVGNLQQSNLTFHAAEAALLEAEKDIIKNYSQYKTMKSDREIKRNTIARSIRAAQLQANYTITKLDYINSPSFQQEKILHGSSIEAGTSSETLVRLNKTLFRVESTATSSNFTTVLRSLYIVRE